jgi:hypothetical protein
MAGQPTSADLPFELVGRDVAPVAFADGIAELTMGFPHSRVSFFQLSEPANPTAGQKEVRRASMVVVIPTAQLLEACKNTLGLAKSVEPQLTSMVAQQSAQLTGLLEGVEARLPQMAAIVPAPGQGH